MDVAASFVAYGKAPKTAEPGKAALNHPAMFAELFFAVDASTGNARQDTAAMTGVPAARIIIALVGVTLFRATLRTAGLSAEHRYGVEHLLEHGAVVNIGAGEPHGEWNAAPIRFHVPLRARLAAIRWIWARGRAPFWPVWMKNPHRPG